METLAIYVFNDLHQLMLEGDNGGAIYKARGDNAALFRTALAELGTDLFLNSTVVAGNRSIKRSNGVKLVVKTPTGTKLIIAKQLLLGIPPVLDKMKFFGLDSLEESILSQIHGLPYYAGLVSNTGLSDAHTYDNVGANTEYHVVIVPSVAMFNPTAVKDLFLYWYNALEPITQAQVENATTATIRKLQKLTGDYYGNGAQVCCFCKSLTMSSYCISGKYHQWFLP